MELSDLVFDPLHFVIHIEEMDGYEDVSNELLNCARTVIDMDNEMQRIKNRSACQ